MVQQLAVSAVIELLPPEKFADNGPAQNYRTQRLDRFVVRRATSYLLLVPFSHVPYCLFCVITSLITSSTNGYDGSMMNGLQSLTQWKEAFNNPSDSMLGLLNAIQASPLNIASFGGISSLEFLEYRLACGVSIRPVRIRRNWSSPNGLPWCGNYVWCYGSPNGFPDSQNVHRCSVSGQMQILSIS